VLGGRYVFGGYRVMTPQANHPIFEHVWMNDVRTFAYVPTGFWVDPLHEQVKDGIVIEDKIYKVFYMSESSLHQLNIEIKSRNL